MPLGISGSLEQSTGPRSSQTSSAPSAPLGAFPRAPADTATQLQAASAAHHPVTCCILAMSSPFPCVPRSHRTFVSQSCGGSHLRSIGCEGDRHVPWIRRDCAGFAQNPLRRVPKRTAAPAGMTCQGCQVQVSGLINYAERRRRIATSGVAAISSATEPGVGIFTVKSQSLGPA